MVLLLPSTFKKPDTGTPCDSGATDAHTTNASPAAAMTHKPHRVGWLVSLLAHVVFRLRLSPDQVRRLPLRSPLGLWGSVFGFLMVTAAILRTWVDSPVALVSGLGGLAVLSVAYHLIRRRRTISK